VTAHGPQWRHRRDAPQWERQPRSSGSGVRARRISKTQRLRGLSLSTSKGTAVGTDVREPPGDGGNAAPALATSGQNLGTTLNGGPSAKGAS